MDIASAKERGPLHSVPASGTAAQTESKRRWCRPARVAGGAQL